MTKPVNQFYAMDKETISMLRSMHQRQTNFVVLADQKASFLLSILLVSISVTVSSLIDKVEGASVLQYLLGSFMFLELVTIFLLLRVILPKIGNQQKSYTFQDMPNPMFFGFFSGVDQQDYVDGMLEELGTVRRAYELMLIDYYQAGCSLRLKYQRLRIAYYVSMLGLIPLALFAFVLLV
jgi:hypothetical protein